MVTCDRRLEPDPGEKGGSETGPSPPKCDGTCLTHLNGVSIAHAQPAAKCGKVRSDPQNGYQRNWSFTGTAMPLKVVNSFGVPLSMPSALAPLSPPI